MTLTLPALRAVVLAFAALAVASATFWVAARPSRPTSRLGLRGLKRQQSLLRHPLWAAVEPLVRWTAVGVSGLVDARLHARLDRELTYAGDYLGMSADEYFAAMLLGALSGGVLGECGAALFGVSLGPLPVIVGLGIGGFVPHMLVDGARAARLGALGRGLPSAIDLMALAMSAGLDFPGSLQQVVEKSRSNEALREELGFVLQNLRLGRTRTQALRELAARAPIEAVREFAQAIIQAEERGNPVASVLQIQAQTSRVRRTNLAEKAATDMRAKMVLPTMMLIGVGLMLVAIPTTMMLEKLTGGLR